MKINLPEKLLEELIIFAKKHQISKIILFGSRARGTNKERSDIDLAICGGNFDGFYWDIKENINSLLSFDLIDLDNSISAELNKEIKKDGIVIYEKN